jgi:hypothetical protein
MENSCEDDGVLRKSGKVCVESRYLAWNPSNGARKGGREEEGRKAKEIQEAYAENHIQKLKGGSSERASYLSLRSARFRRPRRRSPLLPLPPPSSRRRPPARRTRPQLVPPPLLLLRSKCQSSINRPSHGLTDHHQRPRRVGEERERSRAREDWGMIITRVRHSPT